ncbi:MAG: hypothetical protein AAF739_09390 [Pseudomonadota bacterium]
MKTSLITVAVLASLSPALSVPANASVNPTQTAFTSGATASTFISGALFSPNNAALRDAPLPNNSYRGQPKKVQPTEPLSN